MRSRSLFLALILFTFPLAAATLRGTVKDPSGAVVAGAIVTVRGQAGEPRSVKTDATGRFSLEDLAEGAYSLVVQQDGFESADLTVALGKDPIDLAISLKIAVQETAIEVTGKRSPLANADKNYRALRDNSIGETYSIQNVTLVRDVGTITLRSGQVAFLAPVLGSVAMAVFSGEGTLALKPAFRLETNYLQMMTGKPAVEEEFESAVLVFTDATYDELKKQSQPASGTSRAADILRDFRRHMRRRTESARSQLEDMLAGDDIHNIDADLLAELYNPRQAGSFSAYFHGKKHADLRFFVKPSGALPEMLSPEETALVNMDPAGSQEGVWYLTHLQSEWQNKSASSDEDKRAVDAEHYRIETVIGRNGHLASTADLRFTALIDGVRVVRFGLLPNLRVMRVSIDKDREIAYVQESRKEDGSFYVVFPEPLAKGKNYQVHMEYEGDKVVHSEGNGNFSVSARTSWYPSLNNFNDRATFDLIFKVPKHFTLVGVGKLVKEWKEGGYAVSEWISDVPLGVAGFNYGLYKKKSVTDEQSKYEIEAYATAEVPDYLRNAGEFGGSMAPSAMAQNALIDAENSIRLFGLWFGAAPYGRIAITQQPEFNFGQSWPTLVYLPVTAFLDSTQRWSLMGRNAFKFAEFIDEVGAHEVSHQWWGHMVGWSTYHDQWLSEGFAFFSAGLFLQFTESKPDKYNKYWGHARETILEKNNFGNAANDAGPIWMGHRLNTYKTGRAYSSLIYRKGGYVLHMLRCLMNDAKTGDQDFIDMMHDFVKTYLNQNASTERFQRIVEKHMKPALDLEGNGSMGWFFREWVYGTEIPRYRLDYSLTAADGGKFQLAGKITQSDVSDPFRMRVPLYVEFDGKPFKLGSVISSGNSTSPEFKIMLPKKPKRILLNANHDVLASEFVIKEM